MPTYRIETSHGTFDIEADREPTQDEALAAIGGHLGKATDPQAALKAQLQGMAPRGEDAALQARSQQGGDAQPYLPMKTILPEALAQTAMLPAAAVAGPASLLGRMAIGAGAGAVHAQARNLAENGEPAGVGQTVGEAAIGGLTAPVAEAGMAAAGRLFGSISPAEAARVAAARLNNEGKDASLAAMRGHGDVAVVPSSVNPSFKNKMLESVAGIQNVEAGVARQNQPVFNAVGREEASMPADATLSKAANYEQARNQIGAAYDSTRNAGLGQYLDDWRSAATKLKDAQSVLDRGFTTERGNAVDAAQRAYEQADALLDGATRAAGDPALADQIAAAKQAFGKNYDVERSVLTGTDNVRPAVLSQMLEQRGEPGLTGGLQDVAKFNNNFPRSAKNPLKQATAPGAASAATALVAGGGDPVKTAVLEGGIPALRSSIREMLVSPAYQAKNAVPTYAAKKSFGPDAFARVIAAARAAALAKAK